MQTEIRTSTPPLKSWSPGRTLLSTRCSQAKTSSTQSKAHALPAARRRCRYHVRIKLRNLLAVRSPCLRNIGGCKLRYEDREALRVYRRFILPCNQHPKCSASRSASSIRNTFGQHEPVAYLAAWAHLEESVRTKSEHQRVRAQESCLGVEPARVASKQQLASRR